MDMDEKIDRILCEKTDDVDDKGELDAKYVRPFISMYLAITKSSQADVAALMGITPVTLSRSMNSDNISHSKRFNEGIRTLAKDIDYSEFNRTNFIISSYIRKVQIESFCENAFEILKNEFCVDNSTITAQMDFSRSSLQLWECMITIFNSKAQYRKVICPVFHFNNKPDRLREEFDSFKAYSTYAPNDEVILLFNNEASYSTAREILQDKKFVPQNLCAGIMLLNLTDKCIDKYERV